MEDKEKGRLLTAAQVAEIWNERAKAMGYQDTHYTRFSVRQRNKKAKPGQEIKPAMETSVGYLYWERDARTIELQPQKSRAKRTNADGDKREHIA